MSVHFAEVDWVVLFAFVPSVTCMGCTLGGRSLPHVSSGGGTTAVAGSGGASPWLGEVTPDIGAGQSHTCALLSDGTIECWGGNAYGQLGDGTHTDRATPVRVSNLSQAVALAVGGDHACAILDSGTIQCWGRNDDGQLGNGTTTSSGVPVASRGSASAITAGAAHTCALQGSGLVQCWGANGAGQLGFFSTSSGSNESNTVVLASDAIGVSAGTAHTCALLSNGSLQCWGDNYWGELGTGYDHGYRPFPVATLNISNVNSVATGYAITCALVEGGVLNCWGRNDRGQLGLGTTASGLLPVPVASLSDVIQVSPGSYHTCTVRGAGTVKCWGYNYWGELGNGTATDSSLPLDVPGVADANAVAVGKYHTCVLLSQGSIQCWGHNPHGQLGNGTTNDSHVPVAVHGVGSPSGSGGANGTGGATSTGGSSSDAADAGGETAPRPALPPPIGAGEAHTCSLRDSGAIQCWGDNSYGQLGNGSSTSSPVPVSVSNISNAISLTLGANHACALFPSGSMRCWGRNAEGQLGNGGTTDSHSPALVQGLSDTVGVFAGLNHTCALQSDDVLQCWGADGAGQIGYILSTPDSDYRKPSRAVTVASDFDVLSVSGGSSHTCALLRDGSVQCWGDHAWGEFGDGVAAGYNPSPSSSAKISEVCAITSGDGFTCALRKLDAPQCWGRNEYGQLGDGTTTNSPLPVSVSTVSTAMAVAAGWYHACAVPSNGSLQCWGDNEHGELGNGTTASSPLPVTVASISNASVVAAGKYHTCAVLSEGSVQCWGYNSRGQLGDGTTADRYDPVPVQGF